MVSKMLLYLKRYRCEYFKFYWMQLRTNYKQGKNRSALVQEMGRWNAKSRQKELMWRKAIENFGMKLESNKETIGRQLWELAWHQRQTLAKNKAIKTIIITRTNTFETQMRLKNGKANGSHWLSEQQYLLPCVVANCAPSLLFPSVRLH